MKCASCGDFIQKRPVALSRREAHVAALVIQGMTNKKIGLSLEITEKTVKFHTTSIYAKLGLHKRAELITGWFTHTLDVDLIILIHQYMDLEKGEPHG